MATDRSIEKNEKNLFGFYGDVLTGRGAAEAQWDRVSLPGRHALELVAPTSFSPSHISSPSLRIFATRSKIINICAITCTTLYIYIYI